MSTPRWAAEDAQPLIYIQLLWAGLLGWIIFGTIPDKVSLAGMAIVAASNLIIAFKFRTEQKERHDEKKSTGC